MAGGPELVEAFLYGAQNAVNMNMWGSNLKLGLVAFDDCSSPDITKSLLNNFVNGFDVGANVDPRNVAAYTAGDNDAITLAVASILGRIPKPQLGYKPPGAILTDPTMFPFFASLVPGKADGIMAIIQLLTKMGVSNVRLVHDNTEASAELLEGFRLLAVKDNVCVDGIGFSTPNTYQPVLSNIQSQPDTNVLLLHGNYQHFEQFLMALNRTSDAEKYLVIPSSPLMPGQTFLDKRYRFRTIAWSLKSPAINGWRQHLRSLTPNENNPNPWFTEWYQATYNCYLDAGNQQGYPSMCQNTNNNAIGSAPGYVENPYSGYVVMGVGALARALDRTLQQYCGRSYSSVCSQFTGNSQAAEAMMRFLREDPLLNGDWANGYDVEYMRPGATSFTKVNLSFILINPFTNLVFTKITF